MKITCPSCENDFVVLVRPADPDQKKRPTDSPITPAMLRSVLEFMREIGAGRETVSDLQKAYAIRRVDRGWPEIGRQAFVLALQRNGATRWRTAAGRGYDIPEISQDQAPAPSAPSVAPRLEAKAYRGLTGRKDTSHLFQPDSPSLDDLPFEVERR